MGEGWSRSAGAALMVWLEPATPTDSSSRPENRSSGKGPLHTYPTQCQASAIFWNAHSFHMSTKTWIVIALLSQDVILQHLLTPWM